MTSIICKAYFFDNRTISLATTISPSFQAAVTPWILSLTGEKYRSYCSVAEIEFYARSPTFQFTRSLSICFKSVNDCRDFIQSDLCAPLFSHLQDLTFSYDPNAPKNWFDDGNSLGDFVLKFIRLKSFKSFYLETTSPSFMPPSELFTFYMRIFHSQSITQTLLISVVESFEVAVDMRNCRTFREKTSEYSSLIKQHKIIPFLVQKMVETYRNDHGESLLIFLIAIRSSLMCRSFSADSDLVDELVPMLDLFETIVMNGDLLHPCFYNQEITSDPEDQKWALSKKIPEILKACLHSANYSRLDLMQRYGRTLLPQLADFIVSKYDGSKYALRAFTHSVNLFFRVIDDYFWTDEVESRRDEAGLKKMLGGGRRLLQDIPFDKLEFVLREAIKCQNFDIVRSITNLNKSLVCITNYVRILDSLRDEVIEDALAGDVASQLVRHNILPLFFDLVVTCFNRHIEEEGADELLKNSVVFVVWFLQPTADTLQRHLLSIRQDFFSRDGILDKLLDFTQAVCDHFEEVFNKLRSAIEKDLEEWSEAELIAPASHKKKAVLLIEEVIPRLETLIKAARTAQQEDDHTLHLLNLTTRISELDQRFQENSEKMMLV